VETGNKDSCILKNVICIVGLLPVSSWRFGQLDLADVTRVKNAKTCAAASADVVAVMARLVYGVEGESTLLWG